LQINKNIINKTFFKNKYNIKDLKPPYHDIYNFIKNNIKTTPKEVVELSKFVLDNFKTTSNYPVLNLIEIDKKLKTPEKLSKAVANKILQDLLYKYKNLTYDDKDYLFDLHNTSYDSYHKIKNIPGIDKDDLKHLKNYTNALINHVKQLVQKETSPSSTPLFTPPTSPLPEESPPPSSPPVSLPPPLIPLPKTSPQEGSGIQKLFNKIKKLHS